VALFAEKSFSFPRRMSSFTRAEPELVRRADITDFKGRFVPPGVERRP
jgi:hypothetical protein